MIEEKFARWRADGKERARPSRCFEVRTSTIVPQANSFQYSPAADGQRFLIDVYATEPQPSLEVILNWGRMASGK